MDSSDVLEDSTNKMESYKSIDFAARAAMILKAPKPQNFNPGKMMKMGYKFCLRGCGESFENDDDAIIHSQHCELKHSLRKEVKKLREDKPLGWARDVKQMESGMSWKAPRTWYNTIWDEKEKIWKSEKCSKQALAWSKKELAEFREFLSSLKRVDRQQRIRDWLA